MTTFQRYVVYLLWRILQELRGRSELIEVRRVDERMIPQIEDDL